MKANLLAIGTLMALSAGSLLALGPCPTSTGGLTGAAYTTAGGGCNVIITFNFDGSIVTTVPNANPYDGSDDQLVGIVNLSGSAITTIGLSSTTAFLFGFDADGACSGSYVLGAANCPHGGVSGSLSLGNDYLGLASSFTPSGAGCPGASCKSGNVNFAGAAAIAALTGTSWFSLEAPPSLTGIGVNVPEPASIALLGSVVMFVSFRLRRRKAKV